jgi:outer membrane protein TolC
VSVTFRSLALAVSAALALAAPAVRAGDDEGPALPAPAAAPSGPLTLDQAIKAALERNRDQINAGLIAGIAEQQQVTARAAILPTIGFNASIGGARVGGGESQTNPFTGVAQTAPSDTYASYSWGLTARQLIFDGGKWWNNLDAAQATFKSAQAAADEQALQTRFTVEQKFYELLRAQRQLAVFGEAAARSRDQADFVQKLFEGGKAAQSDVYAACANRDNDEVNRLGSEARVELARYDLCTAIGFDASKALAVVEPSGLLDEPTQPPGAQEAVDKALAQRPSLKAAQLTIESNKKQMAAAKGDYLPVISANASYNRGTRVVGDLVDPDLTKKNTLSGSINLNWNLFAGFSSDANVRTQLLQLKQAENDYQSGRRGVASDVQKAVASLSAARAQARVATQAFETAKQGLQLARTRQQVGVGTQLEVRDAELKLTQAQLSQVNALLDGREQESALRRAIGG